MTSRRPGPDIVFGAGTRTPLGNFSGALKDVPMTDLAGRTAAACMRRNAVDPAAVDHMVFTTTVPSDRDSLFAARVVGIKAGLPEEAGALGVVRACASGLQAILSAGQQVAEGRSSLALAGGAESYSRALRGHDRAHRLQARAAGVRGHAGLGVSLPVQPGVHGRDGGEPRRGVPVHPRGHGRVGAMSQARALAGIASGFLGRQIEPIEVPDGKATRVFDTDEYPRADATREKLARLKPAFKPDGRVTAGNASGVTDGAAFVLVGTRESFAAQGLAPAARIVDWAVVGVPARIMGHGPVPAIRRLLDQTGLTIDDIDYVEINEAFAVVNLHAERHLGIPRERHNLYGGGISIGHPPGVTGVRMAMTAAQHLQETGGRRAILSMCLGAGQGMAVLIENAAA